MITRSGDDILRDSIARNTPAVLSLPYLGSLRHFKSRLLAERDAGVLMEMVSAEKAAINALVESQQPVGVSFKTLSEKVIFATSISRLWPGFHLSERVRVEAICLAWPTNVQVIQRRADYRAKVSDGASIFVRISKVDQDQPLKQIPRPTLELIVKPFDLSAGGIGVVLTSPTPEPLNVSAEDKLRIEIRSADQVLFVQGKLRHPQALTLHSGKAGIQFVPQDTLESRQTMARIARIVNELQRAELRRTRRGILGAA